MADAEHPHDDAAATDSPNPSPADAGEAASEMQLESGTYEIIRQRLSNHGQGLRERLTKLNAGRKDAFGSIDTALLGTERIRVETISRSSGMVEMRRTTRSNRSSRATTANSPVAGIKENTTMVKSKTFQPFLK